MERVWKIKIVKFRILSEDIFNQMSFQIICFYFKEFVIVCEKLSEGTQYSRNENI